MNRNILNRIWHGAEANNATADNMVEKLHGDDGDNNKIFLWKTTIVERYVFAVYNGSDVQQCTANINAHFYVHRRLWTESSLCGHVNYIV